MYILYEKVLRGPLLSHRHAAVLWYDISIGYMRIQTF